MISSSHKYSKVFLLCGGIFGATQLHAEIDITELSLKELLNLKVSTASKREQTIEETPAFVDIITSNDLKRRGYKDLSFLLDDLTGIQVTRSFGDNYFNTLWRGIRHTIGSSHLIMIDGEKFNHLYNNEAEIIAAFPLSNIHHIEVVYGPASAVYGKDAVVGLINIITRKVESEQTSKQQFNGFLQFGDSEQLTTDFSYAKTLNSFNFYFSGRYDQGDVNFTNADTYRWTNPTLLSNQAIWGDFSRSYGELTSPHKNRGINFRVENGEHQVIFQHYQLETGYGLEYTFDHVLPNSGPWVESDYSLSYHFNRSLNESLKLSSSLRLRESNIEDDSFFIESYRTTDPNTSLPIRLVDASYWESENSNVELSFEVDWTLNKNWQLLSGIEFEERELQKAYNINFGPSLSPEDIDTNNYPFPSPPTEDSVANNQISTKQVGLFALAEYLLSEGGDKIDSKLHFGFRYDNHSEYDSESSIRAGYVGTWDKTTVKVFYGEAFQEPSARLLYGGWQGSGSDPDLNPRNAKTWEVNANYQLERWLLSTNLFDMTSNQLFNTTDSGAINAGKGKSTGGDIRVRFQPKTNTVKDFSMWASYAWLSSDEQVFENNQLVWRAASDFADTTLHFGSYITFNDQWQLNLRGRYYGDREPIATNPLAKIESFTTLDLNFNYSPLDSNYTFALDITNLFDETFFHPGVRSASASEVNLGELDNNGVWLGSNNFYNAKIPQPSREFRLSFYWNF